MEAPFAGSRFQGLRVLLVEDSYLIAQDLERVLTALGCAVVGPAGTVESACALAAGPGVDAGILDINLHGQSSAPVASLLRKRQKPFFFVTGYGSGAILPDEFRRYRRLLKPIAPMDLVDAMRREFSRL